MPRSDENDLRLGIREGLGRIGPGGGEFPARPDRLRLERARRDGADEGDSGNRRDRRKERGRREVADADHADAEGARLKGARSGPPAGGGGTRLPGKLRLRLARDVFSVVQHQ